MKKILFLIPLLGICSSLLAQAPTVTNVQAEQVQGTKDVAISFELTGKGESVHGEVWFKENDSMTIWTKVSSIFSEISPGDLQPANLSDFDYASGTETAHDSIHIGYAEISPTTKNFIWKAGDDVPNINTTDAKIRIIAFYPKMNEDGVTEKPGGDQVSGWDGIGDFGGSGGTPDGNGTSPSGDVYVRDYADTNNYYVSLDPAYATLSERIQGQYGISPIAPEGYFDDGDQMYYDVFELPDSVVMSLSGMNPPSGMLVCAVVGDFLIPVMLQ